MNRKNLVLIIIATLFVVNHLFANESIKKTALIIIDVQYFYFSGGTSELVDPVQASNNVKKLLRTFRKFGVTLLLTSHTNSELVRTVRSNSD